MERRHNTYALVALLPPHLDECIMPLREKYDPLYVQLPSHITIVFPFEADMGQEELVERIQTETVAQPAIQVEMHSIGDFYPKYPVIYWSVKKNEQLSSLYYRINAILDIPIPFKEFIPHVTVAREISNHRVMLVKDKIAPYLPDEKFQVRALDLIAPVTGMRWVSIRTFPLIVG
jgi:2'-5' RNA ligase